MRHRAAVTLSRSGQQYYGCATPGTSGTCGNRLTIKREGFRDPLLSGLKNQLLHRTSSRNTSAAYQPSGSIIVRIDPSGPAGNDAIGQATRQIDQMVNAMPRACFTQALKDKGRAGSVQGSADSQSLRDAWRPCPCSWLTPDWRSLSGAGWQLNGCAAKSDSTKAGGHVDHSGVF